MEQKGLNLKGVINESSGFCFGVVNAVKMAEEALNKGEVVYSVGQIVHNDMEINRLEKMGLKTISVDDLRDIYNKKVLFRAHGEPPLSYRIAKEHNCEIIDTSCPIILKLQQRIKKSFLNGENIFIFGKHNHPEVIALNAQTDYQAYVFNSPGSLKDIDLPQQVTLYSQTTKSLKEFNEIIELLKKRDIALTVHDTICRQMHNREEEVYKFCHEYDKIIFVAGRNSANGKVLFNICKDANHKTYFVSSTDEIKKEWFKPYEIVGICGATSTPKWQMNNVKKIIESW